jgi:uracil-DNA glycosylase
LKKAEYEKYSRLFPTLNDYLLLEPLDIECFLCKKEGEDFIGNDIILGNGAKNAKFMIVGKDSAGIDESEEIWQGSRCTKIPLTNKKTGAKFRIFLEKTEIGSFSVFITNIVKCNTGYDKYEYVYGRPLTEKEKNKLFYKFAQGCKSYLEKEISIIKPKAIITLGAGLKKY